MRQFNRHNYTDILLCHTRHAICPRIERIYYYYIHTCRRTFNYAIVPSNKATSTSRKSRSRRSRSGQRNICTPFASHGDGENVRAIGTCKYTNDAQITTPFASKLCTRVCLTFEYISAHDRRMMDSPMDVLGFGVAKTSATMDPNVHSGVGAILCYEMLARLHQTLHNAIGLWREFPGQHNRMRWDILGPTFWCILRRN